MSLGGGSHCNVASRMEHYIRGLGGAETEPYVRSGQPLRLGMPNSVLSDLLRKQAKAMKTLSSNLLLS